MTLLNKSIQVYGKLDQFFNILREGQAPSKFNREFLRDIGFKSSNWLAVIGLMKGLGFLTPEGTPTSQYMDFLDRTRWQEVLAHAVKDAYSDIFVMKRNPTHEDLSKIAGKFKSTYNLSDTASERSARTFLALLELADRDTVLGDKDSHIDETPAIPEDTQDPPPGPVNVVPEKARQTSTRQADLHYNIQIHLPATKDIEVYNAIFKSLREHIVD